MEPEPPNMQEFRLETFTSGKKKHSVLGKKLVERNLRRGPDMEEKPTLHKMSRLRSKYELF